MAEFYVEIPGKPLSLNAISQADHWARSKEAATWREVTLWVLKSKRFPILASLYDITIVHHCKSRLMDHANIVIATKACLDSIVSYGPDRG